MTATISVIKVADESNPSTLDGASGLAYYAGGNTPHVWTVAQIERLKPTYLIPIWVRSNPSVVNAAEDARHFVLQLENVYHHPKHKLVALDMEGTVAPAWVKAFINELKGHGYEWVIIYTDKSAAGKNGDYWEWVADWTGVPHMYPGAKATQYLSTATVDLNEFDSGLPIYRIVIPPPVTPPVVKTTKAQAIAAIQTLTRYVNGE